MLMRALAGLLVFLSTTTMAAATGGLSCEVKDEAVSLSLEGVVTRGMGSALISFSGTLELRSDEVREDLRVTTFAREHVAQYWLDGEVLKLRLYRERAGDAPHGYVEVIVETTRGDDDTDRGDYIVAVYDMAEAAADEVEPVQFTGAVSCAVE